MLILSENTIWHTADGRNIKFKDLTDTHLANIVNFIKMTNGQTEVSEFLKELAFKRGLKPAFLERAQIPYKNQRGKWEIWSLLDGFIELEESRGE